jgi:hypothetical protein
MLTSAALLLSGIAAAYGQGHSHAGHQGGAVARVTGRVVDVACFVGHDSSGEKHEKCAEACARAGNSLAVYDSAADVLYIPVSMDHKNPNTKLMPFIEKKVVVKGRVIEKSKMKGIAIESVEPLK